MYITESDQMWGSSQKYPDLTTTESAGETDNDYPYYYPLLSSFMACCVIFLTITVCRECCQFCCGGLQKLKNRLSRCLASTRPFSYCCTYNPEDESGSDNSSRDYVSPPPRYSIALDMPKPEVTQLHEFNRRNQNTDSDSNNNTATLSNENDIELPEVHRELTISELPSYEDAVRDYEDTNADLEARIDTPGSRSQDDRNIQNNEGSQGYVNLAYNEEVSSDSTLCNVNNEQPTDDNHFQLNPVSSSIQTDDSNSSQLNGETSGGQISNSSDNGETSMHSPSRQISNMSNTVITECEVLPGVHQNHKCSNSLRSTSHSNDDNVQRSNSGSSNVSSALPDVD